MLTAPRLPLFFAPAPRPAALTVCLMFMLATAVTHLNAREIDVRDLQSEITAREALAKDPRLQPLNLVVRVNDRVATLSGLVPSRELARRALDTVRKLPEVRDVRDKMLVQFEDLNVLFAAPVQPRPTIVPGMDPPPPPSAPVSVAEAKNIQPVSGSWLPVNPDPPQTPPSGVALLPWTSQLPVTEPTSRPREIPLAKPNQAQIGTAVQNLILGDERFRRMRFEVKEAKVYLSGAVRRWADLEELARMTTRVPGVEGVVLSDVKTDSPRR